MKKLFVVGLFLIGLTIAVLNFMNTPVKADFNSIILDFREDISKLEITQSLDSLEAQYKEDVNLNSVFSVDENVYVLKGDRKLLKNLKKSPLSKLTEAIEPNYIYQAFTAPNDPEYSKQWNLHSIGMEAAWQEAKGKDVVVAVIDTGVTVVPDLQNTKFVPGYDFVNDKTEANDDVGHGTHVAGTIAQSTNNNYGVAGIAYEAKIMPIKVLGATGGGTVADIAEGIRFAADNGANIINLSLGGNAPSSVMEKAVNYAHDKGVVVVAAAGNSNENEASYPARYPKVISVAALDSAGVKAPYSNFGAGVDISAPGGSETGTILQETIDPRNGNSIITGYQGTSMAAPHVAGVAALIESAGIKEPDAVLGVLKQSARKVDKDPLNHFGAGKLNAEEAVKVALKGQLTFNDFFRWLRDSGYLNPGFWIDGGAVALLPKILMVIGSYLLAWFLRNYIPFGLSWSLNSGLILGSSGLFFLQGFYVFDLPQWPFRLMGSSIPELGNIIQGSTILNPFFASALIPIILLVLLLGHPQLKWFAIGTGLGVASCLFVSAVLSPVLWGFTSDIFARSFLIANGIIALGLVRLVVKGDKIYA